MWGFGPVAGRAGDALTRPCARVSQTPHRKLNRTDAQPLRWAAVFVGGRQGSDLTKVPHETLAQRFIPAGPISFQHLASATAERLRAVTPA
jgi:hypothetical protein